MSKRAAKVMSLAGLNKDNKTSEELRGLFTMLLNNGMHGICFSPYEEGQEPGMQLSEEQIKRKMKIIAPHTNWVRTLSCTEDIEMFYFSSFDESWKVGAEGDVGTYWGLWDKDENLKY